MSKNSGCFDDALGLVIIFAIIIVVGGIAGFLLNIGMEIISAVISVLEKYWYAVLAGIILYLFINNKGESK